MKILPQPSPDLTTETNAQLQLLEALAERWPVFAETVPLAIGIHAEIWAAWPDVDRPTLKVALRRYVRSFQYRAALERKGSRRVHLDGSDAGEVEAEHRNPLYPWMKRKKKLKPPAPPPAPVELPAPEPQSAQAADVPPARPVLKLKPKAGPVVAASVIRKETRP